jgi:hypothetical protein
MGSAGPVPRVTVTLGMPPPTTVQRYVNHSYRGHDHLSSSGVSSVLTSRQKLVLAVE